MTHTKGPWRVTPNSGEIGTADGKVWVARAINATTTEGRSNTHLIAAAPELLEALREIVVDDTWGIDHPVYMKCRRAIAKAEGRNQ